ncbi:hypothetical protein EVAR_5868_1 [Eumeta japonica]|uniref:Uncharacterized protein n=1 Tax=Eumeta variegata TaxID=151549 RepID=A0A4C1TEN0_EUMVA|nr:hypothetical protein EVAR_5868_1 [Eumeta japonica]
MYPPHSPDLVSSDFYLFRFLRNQLVLGHKLFQSHHVQEVVEIRDSGGGFIHGKVTPQTRVNNRPYDVKVEELNAFQVNLDRTVRRTECTCKAGLSVRANERLLLDFSLPFKYPQSWVSYSCVTDGSLRPSPDLNFEQNNPIQLVYRHGGRSMSSRRAAPERPRAGDGKTLYCFRVADFQQ